MIQRAIGVVLAFLWVGQTGGQDSGPKDMSTCGPSDAYLSGLLDVVMKQKTLLGEQKEIFDNMMLTMEESINSEMDLMLAPEYWQALGNQLVDDVRLRACI